MSSIFRIFCRHRNDMVVKERQQWVWTSSSEEGRSSNSKIFFDFHAINAQPTGIIPLNERHRNPVSMATSYFRKIEIFCFGPLHIGITEKPHIIGANHK